MSAMIAALTLALLLAPAEAAAAPPAQTLPAIPDESVVLELRKARIAGQLADRKGQRAILEALVAAHPDDPNVLGAALAFERNENADSEATRRLRAQLLEVLARPGQHVPLPLLQDIARDPRTSADEMARLVDVLAAQPGIGAERAARLRLRVALLNRLGLRDDMIAALDELTAIDGDPYLANRLLGIYRDAGRWDDLLRATARMQAGQTGFEIGWWRIEALAALGRYDDLARESEALIGRFRSSGLMEAYVAERFFPTVFLLMDSGRREPAQRLVARLEAAGPELENVKRLRVMMFGSPEDRLAFLAATAGASLASEDPDKVRNEAYQRLLAKDFATAHDLYRRLSELNGDSPFIEVGDWFNYGLASIETEAWADAEMAMTHALAADPRNARALAHRARAKIMQDRPQEGIADAEAALAIDPKSKQACYAMYLAYHKFGNQEKAAEWLARSKAP